MVCGGLDLTIVDDSLQVRLNSSIVELGIIPSYYRNLPAHLAQSPLSSIQSLRSARLAWGPRANAFPYPRNTSYSLLEGRIEARDVSEWASGRLLHDPEICPHCANKNRRCEDSMSDDKRNQYQPECPRHTPAHSLGNGSLSGRLYRLGGGGN